MHPFTGWLVRGTHSLQHNFRIVQALGRVGALCSFCTRKLLGNSNHFPLLLSRTPSPPPPPPSRVDSQDHQPVGFVPVVAIGFPRFDLQSLGMRALCAVQSFQQARRAQMHGVEGAQLHPENLAILLVVLCLQRGGPNAISAHPLVPRALLPCAADGSPKLALPPRWEGIGNRGQYGNRKQTIYQRVVLFLQATFPKNLQ